MCFKFTIGETSLVAQCLRLCCQCRQGEFNPWLGNWVPPTKKEVNVLFGKRIKKNVHHGKRFRYT